MALNVNYYCAKVTSDGSGQIGFFSDGRFGWSTVLVATPTTECRQATLGWSARDCRRATLAGAGDHHRVCLPRQLRPGWLSISVVLLFNTPSSVPVPVSVACIYLYSSCVRPLTSQSKESRPGTASHDVGRVVQEARHRPVQVGGAAGHPQAARCSRRRPSAADQSEAGASSRRPRRRAAGDPAPAAVALAPAVHVRALRHVAGADALRHAAGTGRRRRRRRTRRRRRRQLRGRILPAVRVRRQGRLISLCAL